MFVTLAACADEGPVSGPGTLTGTLLSPNGAEGAALLMVLGDGFSNVTGVGDTEAYGQAGIGSTKVVLVNQAGGELSFRVAVPDTTQAPQVVVEQVAGPDDEARSGVAGYLVEFGG